MQNENSRVLVMNPGSTSTKFGVFVRGGAEWVGAIRHTDGELEQFRGRSALDQLEYRAGPMREALEHAGYDAAGHGPKGFAAVAGRGGLLPPMACGTYLVDQAMVEELRLARRGEHACNLGAVLALKFARAAGVNAYIVDPVTVDEWQGCARLSGSPLAPRSCHWSRAEHQGSRAAVCAGTRGYLRGITPRSRSHGKRDHCFSPSRRTNDRQQ